MTVPSAAMRRIRCASVSDTKTAPDASAAMAFGDTKRALAAGPSIVPAIPSPAKEVTTPIELTSRSRCAPASETMT